MIKVIGQNLWRGGLKIGFVGGEYIIDHSGEKVGFYSGEFVFDKTGRKLARIEGDYIFFLTSSDKMRIEENNKDVVGGNLTNIQRAAARILLGE